MKTETAARGALADDLLPNTKAIANWMGIGEEKARRLCRERAVPAFHLGVKGYAMRKSVFLAWMAERENLSRDEVGFVQELREQAELNDCLARTTWGEPREIA